MPRFLSEHLAELTRQLAFAPAPRRRRQLENAELLYGQIDPQRNYPLDFITFRVTGYRPDSADAVMLTGSAVRADLLAMAEQISRSLAESASDFDPPPLDQAALCERFGVTAKTLSRWRREGLFARHLRWPDGRKRVGFLPQSVDRFIESREQKIEKARRFTRIDLRTQRRILERARRITGRVDASPFRIARHLAPKFHRSIETVRQLLLRHDRLHPRSAIFTDHRPPLTDRQRRVIERAYNRGVPVSKMARRFGKARDAIYRAINSRRAAALRSVKLRWIANPTFELPDAEAVILGPGPDLPPAAASATLDALTEQTMFVRYNYLKFFAACHRDALAPHQPRSAEVDRVQTLLRRAGALRQELVRHFMGLVVSMARKQLAGSPGAAMTMPDLISEGNIVLIDAVETFDPSRGSRFSTYLTWSLMRHFAKLSGSGRRRDASLDGTRGRAESWIAAADPQATALEHAEAVTQTLSKLLGELDERERLVLTRHFGLADTAGPRPDPQTLAEIAASIGISAERARQIEQRALQRLRTAAARLHLSLDDADLFSPPSGPHN